MKILANYAYSNKMNIYRNNQNKITQNNKRNNDSKNCGTENIRYNLNFQGKPVVPYGKKIEAIQKLKDADGNPLVDPKILDNLKTYPLIISAAYESLPKENINQAQKEMFQARIEEINKSPMFAEQLLAIKNPDGSRRYNFTDAVMLVEPSIEYPNAVKYLISCKTPKGMYEEVRPFTAQEISNLAPEMEIVIKLENASRKVNG